MPMYKVSTYVLYVSEGTRMQGGLQQFEIRGQETAWMYVKMGMD